MRVVFLDMDGVLNSSDYLYVRNRRTKREWKEMIDPAMVALLNRVLEITGAKVVLSSSWRYRFNTPEKLEKLRSILRSRGFAGELIDRTPLGMEMPPGSGAGVRGIEVAFWLNRHPEVSEYVILDDSDDFPGLGDRLVRTSWAEGLTAKHAKHAVAILMHREFETHVLMRLGCSEDPGLKEVIFGYLCDHGLSVDGCARHVRDVMRWDP